MSRSAVRSLTRRKSLANDARKALAGFQSTVDFQRDAEAPDAQPDASGVMPTDRADLFHQHAVKRLLWAIAFCERALFLQTNGRAGSQVATAMTVQRDLEAKGQRPL